MKTKVGIFFGGPSEEFEVSIISARNVLNEIDRNQFDVVLVGVDRDGFWHVTDETLALNSPKPFFDVCKEVFPNINVAFPLLHGPFGEDGAIQGLFRVANIPFVGADVLGSAIGMDKDVMKRLLRDANLPIVPFEVLKKGESLKNISLPLPLIVKPANMGSTIGISKANTYEELEMAISNALKYDKKVVVEKCLQEVREFECSLLGLEKPIVSVAGELVPKGGFYDYHNKYIDPEGAKFLLPAPLELDEMRYLQDLSLKAFEVLCCEIMGRVDFLIDIYGNFFISEINTIPGFTPISLYPTLWKFSGISFSQVITKLIEFALERKSLKQLACFHNG